MSSTNIDVYRSKECGVWLNVSHCDLNACHSHMSIWGVTPEQLRKVADELALALSEQAIETEIREAIAARMNPLIPSSELDGVA